MNRQQDLEKVPWFCILTPPEDVGWRSLANEVEVQRVVASLTQSSLHVSLCLGALPDSCPCVIDGEGDVKSVEAEAESSV